MHVRKWIIMLLGINLAACCLLIAGNTNDVDHSTFLLPLSVAIPSGFDQRIAAIAKDPSVLGKLDQREIFISDEFYKDVLSSSLKDAEAILPSIFCEKNRSKLFFSVCTADHRVFFLFAEKERNILGWVPIVSKYFPDPDPDKDAVFWVVFNTVGATNATPSGDYAFGNNVVEVREALFFLFQEDIEEDSFKQKDQSVEVNSVFDRETIRISLLAQATNNVLQVKVTRESKEQIGSQRKAEIRRSVISPDCYGKIPFWPPAGCNGKEKGKRPADGKGKADEFKNRGKRSDKSTPS